VLERICTAYSLALAHQPSAPECYEPTEWWRQLRQSALRPVMQALQTRDITALRNMYRNFFRDPCATGLVAPPYGMSKAYFSGGPIKNVYRHSYIGDALHRIDYWISQTGGRFKLVDLAGPNIGNPFGAVIDGTLIGTGSDYQHYCAHRILDTLGSGRRRVVAEIGGGYGGTAYYLIRDGGGNLKYIDFDVPESIALTSYYLMSAFPSSSFLLYGEQDLTAEADIVLMPVFEMPNMPRKSVDVTFSSHAMSDLSQDAMMEYLNVLARMTGNHFLYFGNTRGADLISKLLPGCHDNLTLVDDKPSAWNRHKSASVSEVERLYRFNRRS
jgi:hypothetical protein